ncbi:MAG: TonB-dependent receptor [Prevotella sp.]|nr:TonB-dependent receptor [Prevotella sp.]
MKKLISLLLLAVSITATAQDIHPQDSLELSLDEVTVEAPRVVQRTDGRTYYPTAAMLTAATQGYTLLEKLNLPGVRVNAVSHTIEALGNTGGVQIRLNDIPATADDLLTLDVKSVLSIDFMDQPGVRYGEGVAYVIDIHTRRATSGYAVGTDLTSALTTVQTSDEVFGKWNSGLSELALSYRLGHEHARGICYDEQTDYLLTDGTTEHVSRSYTNGHRSHWQHNVQLTWNMADDDRYTIQTRLTGTLTRTPHRTHDLWFRTPDRQQLTTERQTARSFSPVLDVYIYKRIRARESVTANVVGTLINSHSHDFYEEGAPYEYETHGRSSSLTSEVVYENRLQPFTLSVGAQWQQRYMKNTYTGDVNSLNHIHNSTLYGFAQLKGLLGQRLSYTTGFGVSNVYFHEGANHYRHWLWRPKAALSYRLAEGLRVRYDFEIGQHVSQIANIADVAIRLNSREWQVGNPDLRPNRTTQHLLQFSYDRPRLSVMVTGIYKLNDQCNMAYTERTTDADGQTIFLHGQRNQPSCDVLMAQAYARWDIIPERLTASASADIFRCFNMGDDYTHCFTAYNRWISVQAYLGRWTLTAYADNGYSWMEGETRGHTAAETTLSVSYRAGAFTLSLYAQHPFNPHPVQLSNELMNRYVQRELRVRYPSYGNLLSLNVTWTLNHGRQYRDVNRTLQLSDRETGIMNR